MPRPAPAILMFGTERVGGPDPERQLDRLANVWVEATELGKRLRNLEERIAIQGAWLDANRDHRDFAERRAHAWDVRKEHERCVYDLHGLAKEANKLAQEMDQQTRERATNEIHAWATIGAPGVEAVAWDLIPDPAWLEEAEKRAPVLDAIPCPF